MCVRCHLVTPCGTHDVCHACAIALRAEIRRGFRALEEYLSGWWKLEGWLAGES